MLGMVLGLAIAAPANAMIHECPSCDQHDEIVEIENDIVEELPDAPIVEIENIEPIVQKIHLGEFKITAYCACSKCCGKYASGYTSIGAKATQGRTIAVDPKVIPYGSIIEINGHEYVAEDCGGAIKQNRIDIYFDSHQDALDYGVQYHDVYLIESKEG